MWITNKTQSQRIGTALPSDLPSEWRTESTVGGSHKPSSLQASPPGCSGSRVCSHCGAKIGVHHLGPQGTAELILNCLYCVLLIAIVLCVGYLLNRWAERGLDNLFDHWVWHEPLNDWNL